MEEWQRLLAEGINTPKQFEAAFPGVDTGAVRSVDAHFPIRINKYFLDVLKKRLEDGQSGLPGLGNGGAMDPLWKQVMPDPQELMDAPGERDDPLAEDAMSPVPNITHRYPDRVLFLVSHQCAYYCRFCTRKRKVSDPELIPRKALQQGIDYIRAHPEVRDVILSGGDPLMLKDEDLDFIVGSVRAIPHVEIIRIGTRIPGALPQRITEKFCTTLKKHHPIYMMVHFGHPDEVTPEAEEALKRLADHGFPCMNQCVLMKGVNDDPEVLKKLFHKLLKCRTRPYYLYQADVTKGTGYFRTPIEKGIEIIRKLRGWTSGLAIPHFVVDLPGGGGKVSLVPEYALSKSEREWVFRNYRGDVYRYPQVNEHGELLAEIPTGAERGNNGTCH